MKRSHGATSDKVFPSKRVGVGVPRHFGTTECVASGATHQGDPRYPGEGVQCVANATCGSVFSCYNNRAIFSRDDFHTILQSGSELYMAREHLIPAGLSYLRPEDLPTEIRVGHILAEVENLENSYVHSGLFASDPSLNNVEINQLSEDLVGHVFNENYVDRTDSILFTGQGYTIAFWRHDGAYYLFNSHGVDKNNKNLGIKTIEVNKVKIVIRGVSRLFKCQSTLQLARLLFANNSYAKPLFPGLGDQYIMHKVRVKNFNIIPPVIEIVKDMQPPVEVAITSSLSYAEALKSTLGEVQLTTQIPLSSINESSTQSPSILCGVQLTPQMPTLNTTESSTQSPSILCGVQLTPQVPSSVEIAATSTESPSILHGFQSIDPPRRDSFDESGFVTVRRNKSNTTPITKKRMAVINRIHHAKLFKLKAIVVIHNMFSGLRLDEIDVNVETSTQRPARGRPIKLKRGRPKTKVNAHRDAVDRYNKNNPQVHRDAVDRYNQNNPQPHRDAVDRYNQNNPQVHRDAVDRYNQNNPQVHRDAVDRYSQNNPQVNRDAVDRYSQNNPQTHRDASQRYTEQNPQVNRTASIVYNVESRNVPVPLRRPTELIGQWRDERLATVPLFTLKKTSLIGLDIFKCQHCGAHLFEEEKSRLQWCCGSGKYNVQNLPPLTSPFYDHNLFLRRPRAYNNLFAFSALGVSHGFQQPDGIAFLKIQGRVYHRVFDLAYSDSINNLGLYINDSHERERIAEQQNLDIQIVRSIHDFLHGVNPFIECFKRLSQEPSDQAFITFKKTNRATDGNILGDMPIGNEIAAIISTDRETYVPRCIAVWKIGDRKPHTVDIMHPLYESFQYPLLYPLGNPGWYPNKFDNNGAKLSQVKYVRCLLLSKARFSLLGRLSEEWLVDMYCRVSEERLRYIANFQKLDSSNALRSAPLEEVETTIVRRNILEDETIQGEGFVPGKVYLPSSFTGGPRYMKTKYSDAIALLNRLGKPTYFLTFTCNPKWPEIEQSQNSARDRNPLVCARVFNLKLAQLLRDIRSGNWFGKCEYIMHVIEFQKRGLPHAHICFRIEGGGPVDNLDIDKFVRADIPPESEAEGRLRKAVLNHMIHGPCGPPHRTDLLCWNNDTQKCSKHFPKQNTPTTFWDSKGYVKLRRDSTNQGVIKYRGRDVVVDERWVVPYNASLLLKYDSHINLEISSQRAVIKYLFKYITKGPDESRVAIVSDEHQNDEIEQYVTKRYIGSSDAAWRTLEFDVCARVPTVKQLGVHLENQHLVYFRAGTEAQAAERSTSDLITYFNRPAGEEFDSLTYLDFFERYLVHAKRPSTKNTQIHETRNNKFLTKRQRGELVARLFWVSPNRGELFYLRMLLASFPCRSYSDLKSLGGTDCSTFQEAARNVGLANDELEYERAMGEAAAFLTASRLRSFFVLLAVSGAPVASLWDSFKDQLSEDISYRLGNEDQERAHTMCLVQISRLLRKHGATLVQHGLPDVVDDTTELGRELVEYDNVALRTFVDEWVPRLSSDQRAIYDHVIKLCTDDEYLNSSVEHTAMFIDGPAGTGKTLVLNTIAAHVRSSLNGVVLCTASSAIAAQNYEGGVTAHSMFKLPLELVDDLGYWNITNGSQRAELIANAKVIIYDEAPMAHKYLIHLLDRSLRDLMRNDKIFGGKIIIFAGDFRQIPPVVTNALTNTDIINASVKTSPIWQTLKTFSLITSQRCRENVEYAEFVLNLGSNRLPINTITHRNHVLRLVELNGVEVVSQLGDLVNFVFPLDGEQDYIHNAILCTRNDAVREINDIVLDRVEGPTLHFLSVDSIDNSDADEVFLGPDALNGMRPRGVPEHDLKLKIGCICMITRNLSFNDGLVNGTKVIVTDTTPRLITVRKANGPEQYMIPRILFKAPVEVNSPFEMCRRQFPLQLCYAMTIHKSQGQTIRRVGVDLRSDVFSHGQLYVALSRVTDRRHIKILIHPDRVLDGRPYANNVIIPELL